MIFIVKQQEDTVMVIDADRATSHQSKIIFYKDNIPVANYECSEPFGVVSA